jgi:two-component system phosphate regulon response regulator PhoB
MPTVLIVEDETDLLHVLQYNIRQQGYDAVGVSTGTRALEVLKERRVDLILLDLMLPDCSGTELCRLIRQSPTYGKVPVLMLTARVEEIDRVVGLEAGADDYITKPFSVRELLLRMAAVLRRGAAPVAENPEEGVVEFGMLRLDPAAHRAWVASKEIELSALEFRLLVRLLNRRNRVQTRGHLLEHVWGVNSEVTTRTVDSHVKRLREKLGDARDYIETVRGVGYRFVEEPPERAQP